MHLTQHDYRGLSRRVLPHEGPCNADDRVLYEDWSGWLWNISHHRDGELSVTQIREGINVQHVRWEAYIIMAHEKYSSSQGLTMSVSMEKCEKNWLTCGSDKFAREEEEPNGLN